ncbi:MAG: hypothetical protein ACQERK_06945 [Campylobacterota bacterium]
MSKVIAGVVFLLLPFALQAKYVAVNELSLNTEAVKTIDAIGSELEEKTGVVAQVVATADKIERGESLYDYARQNVTEEKNKLILIVAPQSKRIGVVAFDKALEEGLDKNSIYDFAIGVIATKDDDNTIEKYNVGVVQAYSELADQIAKKEKIELNNTIANDTTNTIDILRIIVYTGTALIIYAMFIRPFFNRKKRSKG